MTGYKSHRTRKAIIESENWWKECKEKGIDIWETKLTSGEL